MIDRLFNLEKCIYPSNNTWDIPHIKPIHEYINSEWMPFNTKNERKGKSVHFYMYDYMFERVWNTPNKYLKILKEFDYVASPDFSMYIGMPKALQIYNHYRNMWLGRYWQDMDINVIANVGWSDKESFDWCFDGLPTNSVIAISSVGTQSDTKSKDCFLMGFEETLKRVQPSTILWHGVVPIEITFKNIIKINSFVDKFR